VAEIWVEVQQSAWWNTLTELGPFVWLIGAALYLAITWYVGRQQKLRRARAMLVAVNDATFGRTLPRSQPGAWGFAVSIEPPPERFREFNISYQPVSTYDPFDLWSRIFGGRKAMLQIAGVLTDAPTAELIWWRGKPPARALGVNPGRAPWVQSRLDYTGAEYATRGTNVGAMHHAFRDMVARFTPLLTSITVQRERRPQLRLVATGRIETRDVSPLIAAAHTLGRAAMME
jgi:hypothetical protein